MEKIIANKGGGKTTLLIEKASENYDYIVCHSLNEAVRIFNLAKEMGLDIPYPLTYREFVNCGYRQHKVNGFWIDNIEMFLQSLTHNEVKGFSACNEFIRMLSW
jgi:hypothetical protein